MKSLEEKKRKEAMTGIVAGIISAVLFGVSSSFAKMAYAGGSNGFMMTFTRAFFGLPVLLVMARLQGVSLKLNKGEAKSLLLAGIFGFSATTLLLYSSFAYIGVGMATVLHYLAPLLVMLANVAFFREKVKWWKVLSVLLGFAGVAAFAGGADKSIMLGFFLALASSVTYAGLMLSMERTAMRGMHVTKVAVYTNTIAALVSLTFCLLTDSLNLAMTPGAWMNSVLVALMVAVGAFPLLNFSILKCGATTASITTMLEPLTGVLFGYLLLRESLTATNFLGFALIMAGVVLVSIFVAKESPTGSLMP